MTHYSDHPGHVRCEQFKQGGKWYQTLQIDMTHLWHNHPGGDEQKPFRLIHDAVRTAIETHLGRPIQGDGFIYVVLEPYHEAAYPIMLGAPRA